MDRVSVNTLSLSDIAAYWSREQGTIFTSAEIMNMLVQAVWRGDLIVTRPVGHPPRAGDYRYSLLRAVTGVRTHPGLLFIRPGDMIEPAETELLDGGVLVDLRERIPWVAEGDEPSDAMAQAAFATLATVDLDAYDEAIVGPILQGLPIDRDALSTYCESTGIPLPLFWFPKTSQPRSTGSAERQCEKWLRGLARESGKPGSKTVLKKDAMARFPGLSGAAFDRAWEKAAPAGWKEPGAPTKATRRKL
jgi:hypothetical protein